MAVAAIAGMVLAGVSASAAGGSVRPADSTAMLSASPSANLEDGQSVTVTATGYPPNAEADLVECEQGAGCDFSNLFVLNTDADGGYTTTYTVHRILTLDGTQVDCVAAQDCILVSLDISDLSTGAQTAITFDPNGHIIPPLHFRMTPDKAGHVQVSKGVARLTGTVECNQPVDDISADMVLTQTYGRNVFQSENYIDISCSHGGRWSVVFRPVNGLFAAGAAKVKISAYGFAGSRSYSEFKATAVTLVAQ